MLFYWSGLLLPWHVPSSFTPPCTTH
jgi:hypothetical protein